MAELGDESARYHAEIASLLGELGIELVIAVGEPARAYLAEVGESRFLSDAASFDGAVLAELRPGDAIVVKAARAGGREGIPALIEKHSEAWHES
jgi:UDP-N-acetylmuramoyl-tripeptide--D-alanyl-D-alanine ligase